MSENDGGFNFWDVYDEAVELAPPGSTLVEVGVYKGRSLVYLKDKANASGKNLFIVGVDHGLGFGMGSGPTANDIALNCQGIPVIIDASDTAARLFADRSCAFVFIDANHDYDYIRRDVIAWLPKVVPGGTLAGHDYSAEFDGVRRAVNELLGADKIKVYPSTSWAYSVPR